MEESGFESGPRDCGAGEAQFTPLHLLSLNLKPSLHPEA